MSGIKDTGRKAEDTKRCAYFGGAVDSLCARFLQLVGRENPKQEPKEALRVPAQRRNPPNAYTANHVLSTYKASRAGLGWTTLGSGEASLMMALPRSAVRQHLVLREPQTSHNLNSHQISAGKRCNQPGFRYAPPGFDYHRIDETTSIPMKAGWSATTRSIHAMTTDVPVLGAIRRAVFWQVPIYNT
jgi:hypothetical protein